MVVRGLLLLCCLYLAADLSVATTKIRYNTSSIRDPEKLNVHLVPHTHDDAGWLKTVDQYYYGSETRIQLAGVQYILDTVVNELWANKDRRFSYGEMAFFSMWWEQQDEEVQEKVKQLVAEGRLDFINGGWVQHDEAAAHYVAMIDQTTRGHRFLKETFDFTPRIGWQIDPFGHSSTHASLMCGALGFDGLFFGRADYQDMDKRKKLKQMEVLWRGSESYGSDADVFTGNFPAGNYGPPPGFMFEWGSQDQPIMDDPCLMDYNVEQRVEEFVNACAVISNVTRGNDIMLPMGTDFTYANAHYWYKNLDKLIHWVNKDGRINAFYSTPAAYVDAKNSYDEAWPLKTDDFFPYADNPTSYWTGYFTSRPTSKGWIREATSYLQAARVLHLMTFGSNATGGLTPDRLESELGVLQHHDSITGTEKQAVNGDYRIRLTRGMADARKVVTSALGHLLSDHSDSRASQPSAAATNSTSQSIASGGSGSIAASRRLKEDSADQAQSSEPEAAQRLKEPVALEQCPWLNISVCHATVTASVKQQPFQVIIFNPLAWKRPTAIRVPVALKLHSDAANAAWDVTDEDGKAVKSQLVPLSKATIAAQQSAAKWHQIPDTNGSATHEVAFLCYVPPLGYSVYTLTPQKPSALGSSAVYEGASSITLAGPWTKQELEAAPMSQLAQKDEEFALEGGMRALVSKGTGHVQFFKSLGAENVEKQLNISAIWYQSSDNKGHSPSGAYLFRPVGTHGPDGPIKTEVIKGPVVTEFRQELLPFLAITIRAWKGVDSVEVEWTAGPIPIQDNLGKEISIKYQSSLNSGATFYTDSNGREMLKRVRDKRPTWNLQVQEPIAGNYYPLTAGITLQEDGKGEMAVMIDRAEGGASMQSGELEVMVHRRTLLDDARGVAEPINETQCGCLNCHCDGLIARGTHHILLQEEDKAPEQRRTLQQFKNDPVILSFALAPEQDAELAPSQQPAVRQRGKSLLGGVGGNRLVEGLPKNVHLLTLMALKDGDVLLRLAHLYQVNEDSELSQPATIDLADLFSPIGIDSLKEMTLSTMKHKSDLHRLDWTAGDDITMPNWDGSKAGSKENVQGGLGHPALACHGTTCSEEPLEVELGPMEIRTFVVTPRDGNIANLMRA